MPVLLAPGRSTSFSLTPESVTINARERVAEFQFYSVSARPAVFEVVVEPEKDFIVVPAVFRIEPYQTQTFRVTPRDFASLRVGESYNVTVVEVVSNAATPPPSARRYTATLVLASPTPTP